MASQGRDGVRGLSQVATPVHPYHQPGRASATCQALSRRHQWGRASATCQDTCRASSAQARAWQVAVERALANGKRGSILSRQLPLTDSCCRQVLQLHGSCGALAWQLQTASWGVAPPVARAVRASCLVSLWVLAQQLQWASGPGAKAVARQLRQLPRQFTGSCLQKLCHGAISSAAKRSFSRHRSISTSSCKEFLRRR